MIEQSLFDKIFEKMSKDFELTTMTEFKKKQNDHSLAQPAKNPTDITYKLH